MDRRDNYTTIAVHQQQRVARIFKIVLLRLAQWGGVVVIVVIIIKTAVNTTGVGKAALAAGDAWKSPLAAVLVELLALRASLARRPGEALADVGVCPDGHSAGLFFILLHHRRLSCFLLFC